MSAEDVIAKVILALCFSASSMLQGVVVPAGPGEVHHSQADLQAVASAVPSAILPACADRCVRMLCKAQ